MDNYLNSGKNVCVLLILIKDEEIKTGFLLLYSTNL